MKRDNRRFRVYVAGAFSAGDVLGVLTNMRKGMRLALDAFLAGFSPYTPWFDYHFHLLLRDDETLSHQDYYDYSMQWLEVSEAVLVVPDWDNSPGTKNEIKQALELNIPVFYNLSDLKDYFFKFH